MISTTTSKSSLSLVLVLLLFILFGAAIADSSTSTSTCANNDESDYLPRSETKPKLVLSINAANGNIDWERVNSLAGSDSDWEVQELFLNDFGTIMRDESFTAALDHSYSIVKQTLEDIQPDILLASSKGFGVIAYLASNNLWIEHPVILLSPVPNPIDGLVSGTSYELEWSDTIDIYRRHRIGPVLVAVGSSADEEMLISQAMQKPFACGKASETTGRFENCIDWRHVVVPGDHQWKNLVENELVVKRLIQYMFSWLEKNNKRKEM